MHPPTVILWVPTRFPIQSAEVDRRSCASQCQLSLTNAQPNEGAPPRRQLHSPPSLQFRHHHPRARPLPPRLCAVDAHALKDSSMRSKHRFLLCPHTTRPPGFHPIWPSIRLLFGALLSVALQDLAPSASTGRRKFAPWKRLFTHCARCGASASY